MDPKMNCRQFVAGELNSLKKFEEQWSRSPYSQMLATADEWQDFYFDFLAGPESDDCRKVDDSEHN